MGDPPPPQFWNYPFKAFSLELLLGMGVSKQLHLILKRDRNYPFEVPAYGSFCELESKYIVAKYTIFLRGTASQSLILGPLPYKDFTPPVEHPWLRPKWMNGKYYGFLIIRFSRTRAEISTSEGCEVGLVLLSYTHISPTALHAIYSASDSKTLNPKPVHPKPLNPKSREVQLEGKPY